MRPQTFKYAVWQPVMVIVATIAAVGGITFAALQSQPAITKGNTIQTAVASLQVSSNGSTYSSSMDGFNFNNLIPGGQPAPSGGYAMYVRNAGTTPLALRLSVSSLVANPDNVDLSKVHVLLTPLNSSTTQNFILQDLIAAQTSGGAAVTSASRIISTQSMGFSMQVSLDADAITGPSASLSNIDFSFGAVAVN